MLNREAIGYPRYLFKTKPIIEYLEVYDIVEAQTDRKLSGKTNLQ